MGIFPIINQLLTETREKNAMNPTIFTLAKSRSPLALLRKSLLPILAAAAVMACGGGGVGGGSGGTGIMRVSLTDAPACGYDNVFVTVEKVRVNQNASAAESEGGWSEIVLPAPKRVDLLELTNGVLAELGSTSLPAGSYTQLRLVLAENTAANPLANAVKPTGQAVTALDTPSAQQSGLKLKTNITVAEGQTADVVLDFDACKSVVKAGNSGKYNLKPVINVLARVDTGIEGFVATNLAGGSTTVSVSAQQNGVVVRSTVPDASGKFLLSLLPAGTYTVVLTADAHQSAAIGGVPVSTAVGKTTINTAASGIALSTSTWSVVSGTVGLVVSSGGGTTTTPLTSATVSVSQTLTSLGAVEIASRAVDAIDASYSLRLPQAATLQGSYAAGNAIAFSADPASQGEYAVKANVAEQPSLGTQSTVVDVGTSDAVVNFVFP
jgi:Domain of unknown function (DUF4382)